MTGSRHDGAIVSTYLLFHLAVFIVAYNHSLNKQIMYNMFVFMLHNPKYIRHWLVEVSGSTRSLFNYDDPVFVVTFTLTYV